MKELAEDGLPAPSALRAFGNVIMDFFRGFATTLKFTPFLKLCLATFMVFNGFMMVAAFQSYVIIYYVFQGDQALGAEYAGWAGTAGGSNLAGVVQTGPSVSIDGYGEVVEVKAIVGTGSRTGVDMVWSGASYGHFGLDLTGPNGGLVRIDDIEIDDQPRHSAADIA